MVIGHVYHIITLFPQVLVHEGSITSNMAEEAVLSLCHDFWQWRLKESPELASFCGFHQFDDEWDDISEEAYIRRGKVVDEFISKIKSIDISNCSQEVSISHSIFSQALNLYKAGSQFDSYFWPINYLEGIHNESNMSISYMKFETEEDLDKYISRLSKLPARICQVTAMLKRGLETGQVMHKVSIEGVPKQIDSTLKSELKDLGILDPIFKKDLSKIPIGKGIKKSIEEYEVEAKNIVMSEIFPALSELRDFINKKYLLATRLSPGINSLANGSAWYQHCLDYHLTCRMTPEEVHQIGLKEVARIREQIIKLAAKEGLGDSLPVIMKSIVAKQEDYFKSEGEILTHVKHLCHERIRPKLAKIFKDIPDLPLSILPFPDYMKSGPAGYYLNGTPDGSRDGAYYINTHNVKESYPFHLPALSLHEGEPGHHLQMIYSLAAKGLPDFRKYCEDSKYYLPPRNFPFYTAYVEGWGLYSEALGEEMEIYEDSYEWLGRYSFEIFRAARLVVDTGLHAFGWSKEKAVQYMVDNSLELESELTREVDRYITWPGQACAYKIGEIKIWEQRRKAEKALGDKFDIQEFHSRILSCGSVPMDTLISIVDKFIKDSQ